MNISGLLKDEDLDQQINEDENLLDSSQPLIEELDDDPSLIDPTYLMAND